MNTGILKFIIRGVVLFAFLVSTTMICAQHVQPSLSVSSGVGEMYLIERIELGSLTDYQPTVGMGIDIDLAFKDSYFDLSVSYLYMSTGYKSSWNSDPFSSFARVNYNALFFSLSHIQDSGRIQLGYQFGFGLAHEEDLGYWSFNFGSQSSMFPSAKLSGVARIALGERVYVNIRPMLIWSDVIGTFRYNEWNLRGEDAHFFTQLGIGYKFVK